MTGGSLLVAGFLTAEGTYAREWAVACPVCGSDYSHIREAGTLLGVDPHEGQVYAGTHVVGVTSERRSALCVTFDGECGHAWAVCIQQHKGINGISVQAVPAARA